MKRKNFKLLTKYTKMKSFSPEFVEHSSKGASLLCDWVLVKQMEKPKVNKSMLETPIKPEKKIIPTITAEPLPVNTTKQSVVVDAFMSQLDKDDAFKLTKKISSEHYHENRLDMNVLYN